MKVCYVAGKYRSDTEAGVYRNIHAAREVAIQLWRAGFSVVCPALNCAFMGGIVPDEVFPAADLEILSRCDLLVMQGEWWESTGAVGEERFAHSKGIPTRYCVRDAELWLKGRVMAIQCESCDGSGRQSTSLNPDAPWLDAGLTCIECGGSGYGPEQEDEDSSVFVEPGPLDEGCVLGEKCLNPHADHRAGECYNLEMAEAWLKEQGNG